MNTQRSTAAVRARAWLCVAVTLLLAGCASREDIRDAINDINQAFRTEYEQVLGEKGTRTFTVDRDRAFDAMLATMAQLEMRLGEQSRALGFISVHAPAPRPLSRPEWDRASAADLPKARELVRKHVGVLAEFFTFEPEGLEIVITVTIIERPAGRAEIALTMRMRETSPPKSGLPRREYPPPTAVRIGLDKIWGAFEQELRRSPRSR